MSNDKTKKRERTTKRVPFFNRLLECQLTHVTGGVFDPLNATEKFPSDKEEIGV